MTGLLRDPQCWGKDYSSSSLLGKDKYMSLTWIFTKKETLKWNMNRTLMPTKLVPMSINTHLIHQGTRQGSPLQM